MPETVTVDPIAVLDGSVDTLVADATAALIAAQRQDNDALNHAVSFIAPLLRRIQEQNVAAAAQLSRAEQAREDELVGVPTFWAVTAFDGQEIEPIIVLAPDPEHGAALAFEILAENGYGADEVTLGVADWDEVTQFMDSLINEDATEQDAV